MKIQYASDIHHEYFTAKEKLPLTIVGDVLVLAGDVTDSPKDFELFLTKLAKLTDIPVVMVLGNHEYFYGDLHTLVNSYKHVASRIYPNMTILANPGVDKVKIEDVTFIGGTLWTDYANGTHLKACKSGMLELMAGTTLGGRFPVIPRLNAEHIIAIHNRSKELLEHALGHLENEKVVVVTHHSPSFTLVSDKFVGDRMNGGFHSNCEAIILGYSPKVWIYGHTHENSYNYFGDTLIVSNQHGYKHQKNKDYEWGTFIEI